MGFSTVLIISLAAGVILIVGGGLMMYMANIVKSAYEIKVQINNEVDERLGKMGDDLDKKSKWIKRDMIEEFEKIKGNMQADGSKRLEELVAPLINRIETLEAQLRANQSDWRKAVDEQREIVTTLESRLKSAGKSTRPAAPATDPLKAAPTLPGEKPKATPPSATQGGKTTGSTGPAGHEPAKTTGPAPVSAILQEL